MIVVGAGIAVLQIWGVGVLDWLEQPAARVLGAAVSIALVLVVAVLAWEVASNTIERYLTTQDQDSGDLHRRARVRTLLPLMHKALFIFLSLMVLLISLSEIGVDIAAASNQGRRHRARHRFRRGQKLVQDVITGVFMLVEDALSVGDVVEVAGTGGVVEDMSIRSIRLRDLSGNVHTIPFSSVGTVTNMTKDYSYYLLDIGVDYRQDPDQVMEVCKSIVDEMREPGICIRHPGAAGCARCRSVHGIRRHHRGADQDQADQAMDGRTQFNRRMKKRFDELGIESPLSATHGLHCQREE